MATRTSKSLKRISNCTGASGTGRTTFVNTLCESAVLEHKISDSPETVHAEENVRVKPVNVGTCPIFPHPSIANLSNFALSHQNLKRMALELH